MSRWSGRRRKTCVRGAVRCIESRASTATTSGAPHSRGCERLCAGVRLDQLIVGETGRGCPIVSTRRRPAGRASSSRPTSKRPRGRSQSSPSRSPTRASRWSRAKAHSASPSHSEGSTRQARPLNQLDVADAHGSRLLEADLKTAKIRRIAQLPMGRIHPAFGAGSIQAPPPLNLEAAKSRPPFRQK
jgi:hypothetical protein